MHVVIIGGGFAGVKTALELAQRQTGKITLISNTPNFTCHAVLYSVLIGRAGKASLALEDIFASEGAVNIVIDEAIQIDPEKKIVKCKKGRYDYDKLVVSVGAVTNDFGVPGVKRNTISVRDEDDITKLIKQTTTRPRGKIAIVGAGPTGVELAGALSERFTKLEHSTDITIIADSERILPGFSKTASQHATRRLVKMGVNIQLRRTVQAVKSGHLILSNGVFVAKNVIWAAGETLSPLIEKHAKYFDIEDGKVRVGAFLEAYEDVYVIGDNALVEGSGTATGALCMAKFTAKHIYDVMTGRRARPYKYKKEVDSVPIGSDWAYVEQSGIYVAGKFGALTRRQIERDLYIQLAPRAQALAAWNSHN